MRDIAIYGAGGLGREVACVIARINRKNPTWNFIGFFDDGKEIGTEVSHFGKIIGGINELNNWTKDLDIALCFGNPHTLKTAHLKITNPKIYFPNIVVPTFWVSDPETLILGQGNIITGDSLCSTNITIGNYNIFNGAVILGHDVAIGNYNAFMHATHISGSVIIGDCNLFGVASFVKQGIRIEEGITLSPLSALLTKPKNNSTYIGNPAKIFKF